ncbi:hypothetical protein UFOVP787_109 [uncultured Caudovirales phage]|uniref:Uncharacterized protein n=1 Tax=uncultured Caudovirales phage TaxID=2100421 RepID=A0A6J5NUS9_9CAUD|nr:hypothetical protein UFOVP787_109 [uncultured Caudovirales phage]
MSAPNFPTPPRNISNDYMTFPNDLITDNRQFYCEVNFVKYEPAMQLTSSAIPVIPAGGMRLPIPKKLNDQQILTWGELSLKDQFPISSALQIADKAGIIAGITINPMLFMQFQRPNYKEFVLSWTFTADNEQESGTIRRIIEMFKYRSLPEQQFGGGILKYPDIALLKLYPDDSFTFKFRPCAVMSVSVDYTGAGMPSFFKKNGAPTVVNLNIQLKEIQLWDKTNYGGEASGINYFDDSVGVLTEKVMETGSEAYKKVTNYLESFIGKK